MDYAWLILEDDLIKLNVHFVRSPNPLLNGNTNGVGVILRDNQGIKLWGAMGPMPNMVETQVILWAANAGIIAAWRMGRLGIHLETTNRAVFEALNAQEMAFPPEEMEEAVIQFNTLFSNTYVEGQSVRRISIIPADMNRTTAFLASYGMENMASFVEAPGIFGNLQHFLDRDMGLALPMEVLPNFGHGNIAQEPQVNSPEILDLLSDEGAPLIEEEEVELAPGAPLMIEIISENLDGNIKVASNLLSAGIQEVQASSSPFSLKVKGKEKVLTGYSFNENGLLSPKAIEILESGVLSSISKIFDSVELDVEKEIFENIFAKDILEAAVQGKLNYLMLDAKQIKSHKSELKISEHRDNNLMDKMEEQNLELMEVDQAMLEFAMFEQSNQVKGN